LYSPFGLSEELERSPQAANVADGTPVEGIVPMPVEFGEAGSER
jgi:hypothetical protein